MKNARVLIVRIDCPELENRANGVNLKKIKFPNYLPETGSHDNSTSHDIPQKPFGKFFDVLAVKMNLAASDALIAPFESPDSQYRNLWSRNELWITGEDFRNGVSKFAIELQVTANDVPTLSKTVTLEIHTHSLNLNDNKPEMTIPLPLRWIV